MCLIKCLIEAIVFVALLVAEDSTKVEYVKELLSMRQSSHLANLNFSHLLLSHFFFQSTHR